MSSDGGADHRVPGPEPDWTRVGRVIRTVRQSNAFYRHKLSQAGLHDLEISGWSDYRRLPFTTKEELSEDQVRHPPFGSNLSSDPRDFVRLHQTSGTSGSPLRWLDTDESWDWWGRCWEAVYQGAGVRASDRIFFAFSFGPFIGFWSALQGAQRIGAMTLSGGGMSSLQRLQAMQDWGATVLVSTPTYALHLAEAARSVGIPLAEGAVRATIHAGEPGAGLPSVRRLIESSWGARCFDHAGATEVGAWGFECSGRRGLHLNQDEFVFEVLTPEGDVAVQEGELVVTNLGRVGMPVIRYRTGDRVRLSSPSAPECGCGLPFGRLEGGVIGRLDDLLVVRGVNVYPSAVENVLRRFESVIEFGVELHRRRRLDEMEVRIEVDPQSDADGTAEQVADELKSALSLRARVIPVPAGTLPRHELKSRRFVDRRRSSAAVTSDKV